MGLSLTFPGWLHHTHGPHRQKCWNTRMFLSVRFPPSAKKKAFSDWLELWQHNKSTQVKKPLKYSTSSQEVQMQPGVCVFTQTHRCWDSARSGLRNDSVPGMVWKMFLMGTLFLQRQNLESIPRPLRAPFYKVYFQSIWANELESKTEPTNLHCLDFLCPSPTYHLSREHKVIFTTLDEPGAFCERCTC